MQLIILYHPNSESALDVEIFKRDFTRQGGIEPELVSLETKRGAELARTYDIVDYPAMFVARESGEMISMWQGDELPLISEVKSYLLA